MMSNHKYKKICLKNQKSKIQQNVITTNLKYFYRTTGFSKSSSNIILELPISCKKFPNCIAYNNQNQFFKLKIKTSQQYIGNIREIRNIFFRFAQLFSGCNQFQYNNQNFFNSQFLRSLKFTHQLVKYWRERLVQ